MSGLYRFCPICRADLEPREEDGRTRMVCPSCGFVQYRNPSTSTGMLVTDAEGRVLLVRRRYDPFQGLWTMPAGFVEHGERIEETAVRELEEETGLKVSVESLYAVESCHDDPRGESVIVIYRGRVEGGEMEAGDDAEDVRFFDPSRLPGIAFDCQKRILAGFAAAADEDSG